MAKYAFIADCHVGNHKICGGTLKGGMNDRAQLVLNVLSDAVGKAEDDPYCEAMFILGDVVDTTRPTPQMLAGLQQALTTDGGSGPGDQLRIYILVGNHDRESGAYGDHALGPLDGYANITVVEKPTVVDDRIFLVPFKPGPASLWAPADLGSLVEGVGVRKELAHEMVACFHLGLKWGKEPVFLAKADDAISARTLAKHCNDFGIGHVIAGNWHWRKLWKQQGVTMFQCGTLAPTGWDNPGLEGHGTLAFFDTKTGEWEWGELPGPRFVKAVGLEHGLKMQADMARAAAAGHQVFLRWQVPPEEISVAQVALEDWGHDGEIIPDSGEARAAAKTAAFNAKKASTMDEALAGYVGAMELPDGVEPDEVLNRCKGFLAGKGT